MKKVIIGILIYLITLTPVACKVKTNVTAQDLNMTNLKDADDRKKRFFDFMRPLINDENTKILSLRKALLAAKKNNNRRDFVSRTANSYSVDWQAGKEDWGRLLERVDTVALELALAQSAIESAWGQSRFAIQGNNFFGQWCYQKGCGIVPESRDKGTTHEVARFTSVNKSVRSYLKMINTGRVYASLRKARKKDRAAGRQPNAIAQAGGLVKYSQRREKYVKEIRSMIRVNKKLMLGQETQSNPVIKKAAFRLPSLVPG
ncbi:MAG: glucosaminidase domain-containing protein [Gammaproteobacteria bacterium]|nr:glucosaminidase domain-containing protein [Gammaproteobacteria bacterium]